MAKSGEGSRGGTIIGHTKSGRPIYKEGKHRSHVSFNEQDHKDAADLHHKITEKASAKLEEKRTEDNNFSPKDAKGVQAFLNHHYKTMTHHQLKANAKLNEREDREGKTRSKKKGSTKPEDGSATKPNKDDSKKDQILKELYKEILNREKESKKVKKSHLNLLNELTKGGPGSGRKGHTTNHAERNKIASDAIAGSKAAEMYPLDTFMTDALDEDGGLDYMLNNEEEFKQKMVDKYAKNVGTVQPEYVKEAVTYSLNGVKAKLGLKKGGAGSGRRGHQSEGLSDQDLHNRREKFAHPQYAKFRHHSGEGLNNADKFKHGMVQDAKKFGYVKKSEELEKAKYLKREGSSGNYKYTYTETKKKSPVVQEVESESKFKNPEMLNSKTPDTWLDEEWYYDEQIDIAVKPSTVPYQSPSNSTCNLVGRVGFGRTDDSNQEILNELLQFSEEILTDIGVKFKEPIDFTCGNIEKEITEESHCSAIIIAPLEMDSGQKVNTRIVIVDSSDNVQKSILHEIGHAIDLDRSEHGDQTFDYLTHTEAENKELKESLDDLKDYAQNLPFFKVHEGHDDFLEYVSQPTETFARAFEVYSLAKLEDKVQKGEAGDYLLAGFSPDLLKFLGDTTSASPEALAEKAEIRKDIIKNIGEKMDKIFSVAKSVTLDLHKAKYIKREGGKGQYKYTYAEEKMGSKVSHSDAIKEAHGKQITFSGPGGKEYSAHVYSEPDDEGKVILKFPTHGFRRVEISSIKDMHVAEPGVVVAPKALDKGKSLGWPPGGFVEPERKGNKTTEKLWHKLGVEGVEGRPDTTGKLSSPKNKYMSPKGSTCNLVGNVAFGKASDLAQRQLNQKLQMTEVLLSDMGIKMKTPMDFICQDMEDGQRGVMAQFLPMNQHRNDKINLAKNLKTVNKSLLHEIGHGIDYAMEQKGLAGSYFRGNPIGLKEDLDELTKVLVESKFYEATGAKDAPGNIGDDLIEPDQRFADYLKDQSEVFARAFEVYTYSHALDMVEEGKLPAEYTENIVPDFVKAGFSHKMISDPVKLKEVLSGVTNVMDRIFSKRAIQKAMQEVDLLETLRKNVVATDDQGSATETGMYSNDLYSNASNPLMSIIKDALEDHNFGMDPVQVIIAPGTVLTATKVDDGVYSGHVTRESEGEVENVLKIEKQTLPTLLQFLKIKELIPADVQEPEKQDINIETKLKLINILDKLI